MYGASRPIIVVLGSMCRLPVAGVAVQLLHYMRGFERLGFDVFYVEWHGNWVEDPTGAPSGAGKQRLIVGDLLRSHGFEKRWICKAEQLGPGRAFGAIEPAQLASLYRNAEALINVTGAHLLDDDQLECPRRVYVESDPGIPQVRLDDGDPHMWNLVSRHTHCFTFGENINGDDCLLPKGHVRYIPTRQPVLLDDWRAPAGLHGRAFTTVARWRKPKEKTIAFKGERYRWNKDVEFEKFVDLPMARTEAFELALSEVRPDEKERLEARGWSIVDAIPLSASVGSYRAYIQRSRGEFTIAKDQYVRLNTGWFSDRSACYLAAGRPVVTQETGFSRVLPTGEGLFAFRTMDDVVAALDAINSDYKKHSEAAMAIAREYFDAKKVLTMFLADIGLDVARDASLSRAYSR